MKRIIVLLFIALFMAGCGMIAQQPSKVCPPPDGQESWICDKSAQLEVTPEQVYGWIFSATAMAAITDVASIKEICEFKAKIDKWYLKMYPVSYDALIQEVVRQLNIIDDPQKVLLIKNILNQNLVMYSSPALIKAYDDWMLRAGSNRFNQDMMCK